jgi:hypothetical protein
MQGWVRPGVLKDVPEGNRRAVLVLGQAKRAVHTRYFDAGVDSYCCGRPETFRSASGDRAATKIDYRLPECRRQSRDPTELPGAGSQSVRSASCSRPESIVVLRQGASSPSFVCCGCFLRMAVPTAIGRHLSRYLRKSATGEEATL